MSPQQESTSLTAEELDDLIPGYKVNELVSSSTRGTLYQAVQISLDRAVTIKVLPPGIGQDATLRQAFETEAKAMARLNNPNLVDVFDFGSTKGILYIIMEHVPGKNLHETTNGHHVDEQESARLVADLCHGLEHAHQAGIIHRALNPHNILINNEAQAKIVDFGIASLTGLAARTELTSYSAPEITQPGSKIDAKADIYSAGMILYKLIVGQPPTIPYKPPSQIRSCRPEIEQIIHRAIQSEPNKRYSSAGEMAQALEGVLEKMDTAVAQKTIKPIAPVTTPGTPQAAHLPATGIPVAKPSNKPAIIITTLTVSIIIAIVVIVVKSSTSTAEPTEKPTAQKTKTTSSKLQPRPGSKYQPEHTPKPKPISTKYQSKQSNNSDSKTAQRKKPQKTPKKRPQSKPPVTPVSEPEDDREAAIDPPTIQPGEPPKPTPPEFDIDAWLLKARTYMQGKGKQTLASYDKALQNNINAFERDVKRALRKLNRNRRKPAQAASDEVFARFRILGRLPEKPDKHSPRQIKRLYKSALTDQDEVDTKFLNQFTDLRIIYIQGLDKQISNLKQEGNDKHAAYLEEEISLTQKDMARFIRILRGQEPDPEPEKAKKKSKEKDQKNKKKGL